MSLIVKKVSFVWTLLDCVKVEIGETYAAAKRFWMKSCIFGPRETRIVKKAFTKKWGKARKLFLFGHLTNPIFFANLLKRLFKQFCLFQQRLKMDMIREHLVQNRKTSNFKADFFTLLKREKL